MGPVAALVPLIFAIEALGLILRPVTLSFRLSGNMFGDHAVFGVMSEMVRTFIDHRRGQFSPSPCVVPGPWFGGFLYSGFRIFPTFNHLHRVIGATPRPR